MTREGTLCVVFANLKPRKLAHIQSQGMVMCASNADHTAIEVVRPPTGAKIGERVTLEGNPIGEPFSQERQDELKSKKKQEAIAPFLGLLKTNDEC
jgi:aminoacyl tRNA synthase complex-interacting multifunctional protein 1